MKEMKIGYTSGVFDIMHSGHIRILENAKGLCDRLIVGVTTDELAQYKGANPIVPFEDRLEVVKNIRFVDLAIPQRDIDKFAAWKKLKFNVLFVGDDWYGNEKWDEYEAKLKEVGVEIIFFPYTPTISTTQLKNKLRNS